MYANYMNHLLSGMRIQSLVCCDGGGSGGDHCLPVSTQP